MMRLQDRIVGVTDTQKLASVNGRGLTLLFRVHTAAASDAGCRHPPCRAPAFSPCAVFTQAVIGHPGSITEYVTMPPAVRRRVSSSTSARSNFATTTSFNR